MEAFNAKGVTQTLRELSPCFPQLQSFFNILQHYCSGFMASNFGSLSQHSVSLPAQHQTTCSQSYGEH